MNTSMANGLGSEITALVQKLVAYRLALAEELKRVESTLLALQESVPVQETKPSVVRTRPVEANTNAGRVLAVLAKRGPSKSADLLRLARCSYTDISRMRKQGLIVTDETGHHTVAP